MVFELLLLIILIYFVYRYSNNKTMSIIPSSKNESPIQHNISINECVKEILEHNNYHDILEIDENEKYNFNTLIYTCIHVNAKYISEKYNLDIIDVETQLLNTACKLNYYDPGKGIDYSHPLL
jgi:hypothetical protein